MKPYDSKPNPNPGAGNAHIESDLEGLPDLVADALEAWKIAILERQRTEALEYLQAKAAPEKRTTDEIKAIVRQTESWYQANLEEIKKEAEYTRLNEKLMSAKKMAGLRTAF